MYTNNWMPGRPYDIVTVSPGRETSETIASAGISIEVYLRNCRGEPLVGVPAEDIVLWNPNLCKCPGGTGADAPTDTQGRTPFSGKLAAGGCVSGFEVYAHGVFVCTVQDSAGTTLKTNGPDGPFVSPCSIGSSDLAYFAFHFGRAASYSICRDFNESGPPTIDSSDLAYMAAVLGSRCQ